MPSHPKAESVGSAPGSMLNPTYFSLSHSSTKLTRNCLGIFDQVAKESKDSTASSHSLHDENHDVSSGGSAKATAQDHNATPVCQVQKMGQPRKRA